MPRLTTMMTLLIVGAGSARVQAQQTTRDSALRLFDTGQHREAVPLLERVVASDSTDRLAFERLGFALLENSKASPDTLVRKAIRARAHTVLARAVALGSTSPQVKAMLQAIPADGGGETHYSTNPDADQAMQQAEMVFSGGDVKAAIPIYQKALSLDPALYDAAVFIGDAYFRSRQLDSAYSWYERATKINTSRSTAWRYWSDVLLKNNRPDDARDKAIEAIVAEPFVQLSRQPLVTWAQQARISVAFPKVGLSARDTNAVHAKSWAAYDSVRKAWKGSDSKPTELFHARYPGEPAYRHTVLEEKEALQAAYRAGGDDPATINLKKMDDAGVLEALVFFTHADAAIAVDYPLYFREHRDTLKLFWAEFVIGAKYQ